MSASLGEPHACTVENGCLTLICEHREGGAHSADCGYVAAVEGQPCTLVCEEGSTAPALLPYDELPVQMPGTGDIFSSVLIGHQMNGYGLVESVQAAMDTVVRLLERCLEVPDRFKGVPIELHLDEVRLAARAGA